MASITFKKTCNKCGNNDRIPSLILWENWHELESSTTKNGYINYDEGTRLITNWHQSTNSRCEECNNSNWIFNDIKINETTINKSEDHMKTAFNLKVIKYRGEITMVPSDDSTTENEDSKSMDIIYSDIITNWGNNLQNSQPNGNFEFVVSIDRRTDIFYLSKSSIQGFSLSEIMNLMGQIQQYFQNLHIERQSKW